MGFAIVRLVAAGLLVWALERHPYSYYTFLRWAVCGAAAYGAVTFGRADRTGWGWVFGFLAALFNPLVPVHLDRATWAPINVGAAAVMVASLFVHRQQQHPGKADKLDVRLDRLPRFVRRARDAFTALAPGAALCAGGVWLWSSAIGSPFQELRLIRHGEMATAVVIDSDHDPGAGYAWSAFRFRLSEGRECSGDADLFLAAGDSCSVRFDPGNPSLNRLETELDKSVFDWALRKVVFGSLALALFSSPGFALLRVGWRGWRDRTQSLHPHGESIASSEGASE